MAKIEVTWTTETPDGEKRQVWVRSEGDRWVFRTQAKRFDDWKVIAAPTLEDWLALLDGVRRRRGRRRASSHDETRLLTHVRRLFPGARIE